MFTTERELCRIYFFAGQEPLVDSSLSRMPESLMEAKADCLRILLTTLHPLSGFSHIMLLFVERLPSPAPDPLTLTLVVVSRVSCLLFGVSRAGRIQEDGLRAGARSPFPGWWLEGDGRDVHVPVDIISMYSLARLSVEGTRMFKCFQLILFKCIHSHDCPGRTHGYQVLVWL